MENKGGGRGRGNGGQRGGRGNRNQSSHARGTPFEVGESARGGRGRGRGNNRNPGNQTRDPSEEMPETHGDSPRAGRFPSKVVLNVAEKPSIARAITDALRKGGTQNEFSRSKFNPIVKFVRMFGDEEVTMKVTSVTGHIQEIYFDEAYKDWNRVDPADLIDKAEVKKRFSEDKMGIVENIKTLARQCSDLVLWLDCDREGEAIAYEVLDVCASVGVTERTIQVHRAKFSSTAVSEMRRAFETLGKPQKTLSDVDSTDS